MFTIGRVRNNCTHRGSGDGIREKKTKRRKKERDVPKMHLAIPSPRLCYWSLCNDLPKDPDFLATACHKTFGRSSTFSLFVRNGNAASLLCVCHQLCCRCRCCCCWMSQSGCKSPLIILFSSNHTTSNAGTLRASARNHQSAP